LRVAIAQAPEQPNQDQEVQIEDSPLTPDLAVADTLYQEWLKEQAKPKIALKRHSVALQPSPSGYNVCSCVSFARWKTGINVGSIGVARNHPVNSHTPSVGAIVVTYESYAGHLAVVTAVDGQYISVIEANHIHCQVGTRTIRIDSPLIKGYYSF
jgi:hypothetical protein